MFAVLRGEAGSSVRQAFEGMQKISPALTFLRANLQRSQQTGVGKLVAFTIIC